MIELDSAVKQYFPYDKIRTHQDEFIEVIYEAIDEGCSVLVEGSNGLGKTAAALSACLPSAMGKNFKILYVARTHRQHDRVIEELKAISKKKAVTGVSIRGRHEMCLNPMASNHRLDARSAMEICELLKAKKRCRYFENIDEHSNKYYETKRHVLLEPRTASEIQRICRQNAYCPYELVKSLLSEADVVALSYLYVFDPTIRTFFLRNMEISPSRIILIIDEAHNLPETALDIASSRLTLFGLKHAENEAKEFGHRDIAEFARAARKTVQDQTAQIQKETLIPPSFLTDTVCQKLNIELPGAFFERIQSVGLQIKRILLEDGKNPRSFINALGSFMLKWKQTSEDPSFIRTLSKYQSRHGVPTARLQIVALDPSKITEPVFSSVYSSVVISGTLQPLEAYVKMTKLPHDTKMRVVPSPFPKEHVLAAISTGVTTSMENRTDEMYRKIISRIKEVAAETPVNTGVFAPSFEVLNALLSNGLKNALTKPLFCEYRSMNSSENEKMISDFKNHRSHGGAVLLGVQGGRSSEGVDYPGDEMNSVAVVGVPYAEPTPRVKAQIDYYEKRFPSYGREYGYVLQAMKKACQAAGRPIRTPTDKGAIVFLDQRFASAHLQGFLPLWIRENLRILPDKEGAIEGELTRFF